MAELDLSKVSEAIDRALWNGHDIDAPADIIDTAITAALPHILDALASQAHCERVFAGSFPPVKEDAYIVAQWLHAKAEEARR